MTDVENAFQSFGAEIGVSISSGPSTFNESYNRPPYILAASAENKNMKSMVFILYRRRILAKVSSSNFTSTGCLILEIKVPSFQKVTCFAQF